MSSQKSRRKGSTKCYIKRQVFSKKTRKNWPLAKSELLSGGSKSLIFELSLFSHFFKKNGEVPKC